MVEPVPERREFAEKIGAQVTAASVGELLGAGSERHVVFECSGDNAALGQALDLVRPNGRVIVVGIPELPEVCFDCGRARRNQISITFSRRSLNTLETAVELIASGQVDLSAIPVRTFSLDEAPEAFVLAAQGPGPELRLVVTP